MKKLALALFTILFVSTSIFAQSDLQVLAVVKYNKSESISVRQVKKRVAVYENQFKRKMTLEEKKEVLNTLIEEKLLVQAAQKRGISIPESDVNKMFISQISSILHVNLNEKQLDDFVKQNFNVTTDEFFIQTTGMNKNEYKEHIRNQAMMQQYVMAEKRDELQKVAPTDEQIRMFYEANKSSFIWNDMAKLFAISVPKEDNSGAAKLKIDDYRKQISGKKTTYEKLIAEAQKDKSGFQAGELIVEKTEQFANGLRISMKDLLSLFTQDVGFISDVYETSDDYRFFAIIKKYDAKMLAIGDLVRPETTVTVYDYIRQGLTNEFRKQFFDASILEVADSLNVPANVEMKKTGADLDKLLNWGD